MRYSCAIGTILAVILLSSPSSAAPVPPRSQLEDFLSRATAILVGATDAKQAGEDVRNLAGTLFDGRTAARRALGPEWDRHTGPEREEFARTLTAVLARAYVEVVRGWLPRDRPPAIRVLGEDIAAGGRLAIVRTSVQARDGSDVQLDYTMIRADGAWLVHDVVIDGVSLLENYRVQFARVLRTLSYTELMARLRAVAGPGVGAQVVASSKTESHPEFIVAYFDTSRADLHPAAQRALAGAVTWLAANERARTLIEGHADQQGASRLNQALAERRANAIRDNLVARGVDPDRIAVVAYGDRRPVCQEPLEKCQAQNRRAVVRLTP